MITYATTQSMVNTSYTYTSSGVNAVGQTSFFYAANRTGTTQSTSFSSGATSGSGSSVTVTTTSNTTLRTTTAHTFTAGYRKGYTTTSVVNYQAIVTFTFGTATFSFLSVATSVSPNYGTSSADTTTRTMMSTNTFATTVPYAGGSPNFVQGVVSICETYHLSFGNEVLWIVTATATSSFKDLSEIATSTTSYGPLFEIISTTTATRTKVATNNTATITFSAGTATVNASFFSLATSTYNTTITSATNTTLSTDSTKLGTFGTFTVPTTLNTTYWYGVAIGSSTDSEGFPFTTDGTFTGNLTLTDDSSLSSGSLVGFASSSSTTIATNTTSATGAGVSWTSIKTYRYLPWPASSTHTEFIGATLATTKSANVTTVTTTNKTQSGLIFNITSTVGVKTTNLYTDVWDVGASYPSNATSSNIKGLTAFTVESLATTAGVRITGLPPAGTGFFVCYIDQSASGSTVTNFGTTSASDFSSSQEGVTNNGTVGVKSGIFFTRSATGAGVFEVEPNAVIGFRDPRSDALTDAVYSSVNVTIPTYADPILSYYTTMTGTETFSRSTSSTISSDKTLSTIRFQHISLQEFSSGSVFMRVVDTDYVQGGIVIPFHTVRAFSHGWASYVSTQTTTTTAAPGTTTVARTTTTTTNSTQTASSTTTFSEITMGGSFIVRETSISSISNNVVYITRSFPAIFMSNGSYYSHDERNATPAFTKTETLTASWSLTGILTNSTYLSQKYTFETFQGGVIFNNNVLLDPFVMGGFCPVSSTRGFHVMYGKADNGVPLSEFDCGLMFSATIYPRTTGGTDSSGTTTIIQKSLRANPLFGNFVFFEVESSTGDSTTTGGTTVGNQAWARGISTCNLTQVIFMETMVGFNAVNHTASIGRAFDQNAFSAIHAITDDGAFNF